MLAQGSHEQQREARVKGCKEEAGTETQVELGLALEGLVLA